MARRAPRPAGATLPAPGGPRRIPDAAVARLGTYHRVLTDALAAGSCTVSSEQLAGLAGVNASQVRKDLSYLGPTGTRGVGYDVEHLLGRIGVELGLTRHWPVVIVGAGNLGRALANYRGLAARGFVVAGLVDADPTKVGRTVGGLAVEPLEALEGLIAERRVRIGVIATPASAAQEVADRLVAAGVRAILNFAPAPVGVPPGVSVRKVDLALELQVLSYHQVRATTRTRGDGTHPRRAAAPALRPDPRGAGR